MPMFDLSPEGDVLETNRPIRIRPIDLVHLAKYTQGDHALEHEVLSLFRQQASVYLQRLEAAGDQPSWYEAAHTLKGCARNLGAWSVAELCEVAEDFDLCLGEVARVAAITRIRDAVDEATRFIDELLRPSVA